MRVPLPATALLLATIAVAGCAAPRLAYYPAGTPEPLSAGDEMPLTAQVVHDGAELLAAPDPDAARLATLAFGDSLLLYAFQPARGPAAKSRHALVGPPGEPGTVSGWVPAGDLLPADAVPKSRLAVHAGPDTALRSGPGPGFPATTSAEHWFMANVYAERGGHLLVGPLEASGGARTPGLGGWLDQRAAIRWDGTLGARFFTENFGERELARIEAETGGKVLYAEPSSHAPLPPGANRFPVLARLGDGSGPLQVALPGGALGQVSEFGPNGQRQVILERLLSRAQIDGARQLFRRVTDRARGEPRSLAAAVEAATGSPTTSLGEYSAETLGLPLRTPPLELPAEALATECLRNPGRCTGALAALRRSADALDSVEEEIAVQWVNGEAVPVREHSWSKGPRPRPYWWRGGDGRDQAWVPLAFLP